MVEYGNDPVSAIAEEDAVGEVAGIFADIRDTMGIPLLTSIWRTLVSVDGGLEAVWKAAKPIYLSGQPELALSHVVRSDCLPVLKPLTDGQLQGAGLSEEDIVQVRAIVAAYNRSNGMNMLALGCLVVEPSGIPLDEPYHTSSPSWPPIRRLAPRNEIAPEIWKLLLEINRFGSVNGGGLATLWRHLAHWPGLLKELQASFTPMHRSGRIEQSVYEVHELSTELAGRMAHIRSGVAGMPEGARRMVEDYVAIPGAVTRMVTLGHAVAKWLDPK
jgi:hypothetical protein